MPLTRPSPLPTFKDGALLSARDLRILAENEDYLDELSRRVNPPFRFCPLNEERHLIHRHQFLRYQLRSPNAARIWVNNVEHAVDHNTPGLYALDLDSDGANPFSLTLGQPYPIKWLGTAADIVTIYEYPTTGETAVLPNTTPNFTNGAQLAASDLNDISGNLRYLLNLRGNRPVRPFLEEQFEDNSAHTVEYRFHNRCRYLFVTIKNTLAYELDQTISFNTGSGYVEAFDGGYSGYARAQTRIIFDLDNGTATNDSRPLSPLDVPLTPVYGTVGTVPTISRGSTYDIKIETQDSVSDTPEIRIRFACETASGFLF